jgi:dienelactone hydrolase
MHTEPVEYRAENVVMQGFVARISDTKERPIVMLVHDWSGCREFAQDKAKYFAEQGYVGFAVDLYGKGKRGSDNDASVNQGLMGPLMEDRSLIVTRLQAALDCAKRLEKVQADKIVVLGFCFGGLCALDFARSGADIAAAISIHGLFFKPETEDKPKITAKILALHGYLDKMATPELLAKFQEEMTERGADWQTHVFGNTHHAFTNPKANDSKLGLHFSGNADSRTWPIVNSFLREIIA